MDQSAGEGHVILHLTLEFWVNKAPDCKLPPDDSGMHGSACMWCNLYGSRNSALSQSAFKA